MNLAAPLVKRHNKQRNSSKRRRSPTFPQDKFLTEQERSELLFYWGGFAASLGFGSVHSAVEQQLLRSPPREFTARTDTLTELVKYRIIKREKLVELVHLDHGLTKFEVRRGLTALLREGIATAFKEIDKDLCTTDYIKLERIPKWCPPEPLTKEEKWRRQDEALRLFCLGGPKGNQTTSSSPNNKGGGSSESLHMMDEIESALMSIDYEDRIVLERAYGSKPSVRLSDFGNDEVGKIVPITQEAQRARELFINRRIDILIRSTNPQTVNWEEVERKVVNSVTVEETFIELYDRVPEEPTARARFRAARDTFTKRARREAEKMLTHACLSYRKARQS